MTFVTWFSLCAVKILSAHRIVHRFQCLLSVAHTSLFILLQVLRPSQFYRLFDQFTPHATALRPASGWVPSGFPANATGSGSSIIVTLKSVIGIAVPGIDAATIAWPPFPALTHLAFTTSSAVQTSLQVVATVRLRVSMTAWQFPSAVRLEAFALAQTCPSIPRTTKVTYGRAVQLVERQPPRDLGLGPFAQQFRS